MLVVFLNKRNFLNSRLLGGIPCLKQKEFEITKYMPIYNKCKEHGCNTKNTLPGSGTMIKKENKNTIARILHFKIITKLQFASKHQTNLEFKVEFVNMGNFFQ